ncbi:MAG: hypothetical protein AAF821_00155 [Cyanobacteria bacterium P01_D01_bin.156]
MTSRQYLRVIQQLGQGSGILFLPVHMIGPAVLISGGSIALKAIRPDLPWSVLGFMVVGGTLFWFLLTFKEGSFRYLNKLFKSLHPRWRRDDWKQETAMAQPLLMQKTPEVESPAKQLRAKPLYKEFHLVAIIHFVYQDKIVEACLLERESSFSRLLGGASDWRVVFGFQTQGIHSYTTEDQFARSYSCLDMGLREFSQNEHITFSLRLRADASDCRDELLGTIEKADNTAFKILASYELGRREELATARQRKLMDLLVFATYTEERALFRGDDWVALIINSLQMGLRLSWLPLKLGLARYIHYLKGDEAQQESAQLSAFLRRAYTEGYFHWESFLTQKLKLSDAIALSRGEYWQEIWSQLNGPDPVSDIPRIITVTATGSSEEITTPLDPRRMLLQHIPDARSSTVDVAGNCVMLARCIAKPGGATSAREVMHFIFERIHESNHVEIITQLSKADSQMTRALLNFQSRRASHAAAKADAMNIPDVGALQNRQGSLDAESAILSGQAVLKVAFVIKVTAPTYADAHAELRKLCRCWPMPMQLEIDRYGAWRTWLQTLHSTWEQLLVYGPFDQRQLMLSSEVPLLLPIVMPRCE